MFVTSHTTQVRVKLPAGANFDNFNALTDFDLIVELPDQTVAYDDNITGYGSAAITAPTATEDGLLTFDYTPAVKGRHTLTVTTGTSTGYTVLATTILSVIDPTATINITAKLP